MSTQVSVESGQYIVEQPRQLVEPYLRVRVVREGGEW